MENTNHLSDDQLSKMFTDDTMDFDQDAMWANLEQELDKRPKRRMLLWFFTGLLLFGAIGTYFYSTQSSRNKLGQKEPSQEFSQELNTSIATTNTLNNKATSTTNAGDDNNAKAGKIQQNTRQSRLFANEEDKGSQPVAVQSNEVKYATSSDIHAIGSKTTPSYERSGQSTDNRNQEIAVARELDKLSSVLNTNTTASSTVVQSNTSEQNTEQQPLDNSKSNARPSELNETENNSILANSFTSIGQIAGRSLSLFSRASYPLSLKKMEDRRDWSRCDVRDPWVFAAELYGGYAFPIISNSLNRGGDANYLSDWDDAHTPVGGFQAGLQLIGQSPSGFEVGVGVEYQNIVEKLESELTYFQTLRIVDPMAYFYRDTLGQIVWVEDTVTVYKTITETRTAELRHRLINIPIRIGKIMRVDDWRVGAHIGGVVHLNYSFDGLLLQPNGTYVELDDNNFETVYNKDISFSALVDMHIGRMINDNAELFIQPSFRYRPSSFTQDAHQINTKIHLAQISGGLRYYFN